MWTGLLLALLGTAVANKEQKKVLKEGIEQSKRGRAKQKKIGDERRQEVLETLEEFNPETRKQRREAAATEAEGEIRELLTEASTGTGTGDVGKISDVVLQQRADQTRDRANEASILAAMMSKVRAPGDVAAQEALTRKGLVHETGRRESEARRTQDVTDAMVAGYSEADPEIMMTSGLMQQLGLSMASGDILKALAPSTAAVPPVSYTGPGTIGVGRSVMNLPGKGLVR